MQTSIKLLKAPNHFESDFGNLDPQRRREVIAVLRTFMEDLRGLLEKVDPVVERCRKDMARCTTCAFEPSTDAWPGFAATTYGLLKSFGDEHPFYCHRNQILENHNNNLIDPTKLPLCNGFITLMALKRAEVKALTQKASTAIQKIVPDKNFPT